MIPRNATPSVFKLPSTKRKFAFRYTFNGKEKENEIASGDLDFGARIYSAALGKFISTDPDEAIYADVSPYTYATNNPVRFIDVLGRGAGDPMTPLNKYNDITTSYVIWEENETRYIWDRGSSRIVYLDLNGPTTLLGLQSQFNKEIGPTSLYDLSVISEYADAMYDAALIFSGEIATGELGYNEFGMAPNSMPSAIGADPKKGETWHDRRNSIASSEKGKTFRHMAFQAYMTLTYSYRVAKLVGDFHEMDNLNKDSNFDLINNQRGRDFAISNKGKYDMSSGASIATMLNDIANVVHTQYGLPPIESGKGYFNENQQFIKDLVIEKK